MNFLELTRAALTSVAAWWMILGAILVILALRFAEASLAILAPF